MTTTEILFNLGNLIVQLIKKEFTDQGHYLTGKSIESLRFNIIKGELTLTAKPSLAIVNEGIPANRISWKMMPGLIKYFRLRGFNNKEAKKFAELTIKRWQEEGMSTEGSRVYSKTGERQHFIEKALSSSKIDQLFAFYADKGFNDEADKSKSEII